MVPKLPECRRQCVVLNGQSSDWVFVKAGVSQESTLGLLLFLIYINDIVNGINSAIRLIADDTSLYIIVGNPQIAANMINHDLDTIDNWARTWLVDFNPAKTISITLTRKHQPGMHPPLSTNNTAINEELCHTHLGLPFSKICTWNQHINNISAKAWVRLNL